MDHSISDCLNLDFALLRGESQFFVLGDALSIDAHVVDKSEPRILLVFFGKLGGWVSWLVGESDWVSWLAVSGGHQKLDSALVWGLTTHDHTMRGEPS